jgi:4-hydroxy-3-polyprenylbenzoate decarboxylase
VHPLLLAIGSERYLPYQKRKPQELLQLANAILGTGPHSLAKYLFVIAGEDNPKVSSHEYEVYFRHFLERVDPQKDLHFQTMTTMDTLDYSGTGINQGSKVILAAAGEPIRKLPETLPAPDANLGRMHLVMPGVLMMEQPAFKDYKSAQSEMAALAAAIDQNGQVRGFPLIVVCDRCSWLVARGAEILKDFLWITFTRANPSHDIYGVNSFTEFKHWGCDGAVIIDARIKPHHAPVLMESRDVVLRVNTLIENEPVLKQALKL